MFITPEWLKEHKICEPAQERFKRKFPSGTDHLEILRALEEESQEDVQTRRWYVVFKRKFVSIKNLLEEKNGRENIRSPQRDKG